MGRQDDGNRDRGTKVKFSYDQMEKGKEGNSTPGSRPPNCTRTGGSTKRKAAIFSLVQLLFGLTISGSVVYMYVGYLINSFPCEEVAQHGPCLPSSLVGGNLSIIDYVTIASSMTSRAIGEANRDVIQWARGSSCGAVTPCYYPDEVSLRVIVLVMNRVKSLEKLLQSLDTLDMDPSETSALEIWIDREKNGGVSQRVYRVATSYVWRHGPTRVYVHRTRVGLYGQWMQTWRPRNDSRGTELALILEDDISVSPYAWRWIRAVHAAFGHRTDIAGYTLQSENINRADGKGALPVTANDTTFLYGIIGSWGFVPHPARWTEFLSWYERVRNQQRFKPYVRGVFQTDWYRKFEREGKQDTMWTMWFIRFSVDSGLSVVYANLSSAVKRGIELDNPPTTPNPKIMGHSSAVNVGGGVGKSRGAVKKGSLNSRVNVAAPEPGYYLAVHRQEAGLHFSGLTRDVTYKLLKMWKDDYVRELTPDDVVKKFNCINGTWMWSRVGGPLNVTRL